MNKVYNNLIENRMTRRGLVIIGLITLIGVIVVAFLAFQLFLYLFSYNMSPYELWATITVEKVNNTQEEFIDINETDTQMFPQLKDAFDKANNSNNVTFYDIKERTADGLLLHLNTKWNAKYGTEERPTFLILRYEGNFYSMMNAMIVP
jgi:hypothetical protein